MAVILIGCNEARLAGGAVLVRGPYLQSGSSTGVVVRWRTDVPTDSVVRFNSTNGPEIELRHPSSVVDHEVALTGLIPGTTCHYSIGFSSNLLADGTNCYFRTDPTNARPVRVWAIGDAGVGTANQMAVRDAYMRYTNSSLTDVWLMLGDNAYELADDADFQTNVFEIYPEMFRHAVCWPAIGNHETVSGELPIPLLTMFTVPTNGEAGGMPSHSELYYSFDYANVHFICLDSEVSGNAPDSPMLNWLRGDLEATTKDWIVVYWHHPPYSMGTDFSDLTAKLILMRERVLPILENNGVDLVICGHSHVYERSFLLNGHFGYSWTLNSANVLDPGLGRADTEKPYRKPIARTANSGTVYIVCGNSGQGGEIDFQHHPAMAVTFDGYGSIVLDIDGLRLDAKYLRSDGTIADHFTIEKSAATAPALAVSRSNNVVMISWFASPEPFSLESAPSLPSVSWNAVTVGHTMAGGTNVVQVSVTNAACFFRLRATP